MTKFTVKVPVFIGNRQLNSKKYKSLKQAIRIHFTAENKAASMKYYAAIKDSSFKGWIFEMCNMSSSGFIRVSPQFTIPQDVIKIQDIPTGAKTNKEEV